MTISTDDYLREAEQRARRFQGAYTGTSGTLAADVIRLIEMIRRGVPAAAPAPPGPRRLIGITGPAGAGKDAVASMIPGARRIGFSDPLYDGLAAMLGVRPDALRDRRQKEAPMPGVGASPRRLLQTLGTEWGRQTIADGLWVTLARDRWDRAWASGAGTIVVPDVRFTNEADAIREAGGQVWLVHRPDLVPIAAHVSEAGLPLRLVDRLVVNAGTLEDLRARVEETLQR